MLGNLSFYLTLNSGHIHIALFYCLSQQKDLYHEPGCKNRLIIAKKKRGVGDGWCLWEQLDVLCSLKSGISEEVLKAYDGNNSQKPSLMAIVSQIYDVSQRWYILQFLFFIEDTAGKVGSQIVREHLTLGFNVRAAVQSTHSRIFGESWIFVFC
ncbi:hypothetical protein HanRHA438_Chr10g0444271 [Helianthus annuus]|nr:hypothetical protein HanRHA438_Chr10g0444271 [Helianthus annuus]